MSCGGQLRMRPSRSYDAFLATPSGRRLSIQLAGEAIAVGQALGFNIENVRGLSPDVLRRASQGDTEAFDQVEANTLKSIARMTDDGRPSTGQDIVKGRRTEIDFLNGLVADKGEEAGISAPTHRALVQVVKEVEKGEVTPSPSLVDRVWELSGIRPVAIAQPAR